MAENKQTDKQKYNLDQYIRRLKEGHEVYKKRKDYIKEFSLKKNDKSEGKGETPSAESTSLVITEKSDYSPNGKSWEELGKLSLKGSSGLTAKELAAWLDPRTQGKCKQCGKISHMHGMAEVFIQAEKENGYRADAMVAQAAEESGWGTSTISCRKKNWFGYGANDSNPYGDAYSWKNHTEGLLGATKLISKGYIYRSKNHKGQKDQDSFWLFNNPPKENGSHRYASNNQYVKNVCTIWSGAPTPGGKSKDKKTKELYTATDLKESEEDKGYVILNPAPTREEILSLTSEGYNESMPKGFVKGLTFQSPKYPNREYYISGRKATDEFRLKQGYEGLPFTDFIHLSGEHENLYASEARDVFTLLKNALGYKQIVVSRGFEHSKDNGSSHSIGIAMDIYAANPIEAIRIADTAWAIGIKSIAIGPHFVHVDTGPESTWNYDQLVSYRGPGTVSIGRLKDGFR